MAYHGELEKKAAMEKQRGTAEVVEARGTNKNFNISLFSFDCIMVNNNVIDENMKIVLAKLKW